jgi:hypothetical protein
VNSATSETSLTIAPSQFDLSLHNAIMTIFNPRSGDHRTFKVSSNREDTRFVSLLIGPETWQSFAIVGTGANDKVAFTFKKFQACPGDRETNWQKYTKMINRPEYWSRERGLEYFISSRCRICNRVLSHPNSITIGIGPECAKRI